MFRVENSQGVAWFNAVDDKTSINHGKLKVDLFPNKPDSLGFTRHESLCISEHDAVALRDYLNKSYSVEAAK